MRRYLKRDKKDAENFKTVFGPVLEMLGKESTIDEVFKRSAEWAGDASDIAAKEMACLNK